MEWGIDQETLTQEARLLASGPEEVFRELKVYGERIRTDPLLASDEQLEEILFKRGEPLIDLALARYGANQEVVAELYSRAITATDKPLEARYRKGLQIACLSNQSINLVHFLSKFPAALIGSGEIARIIAAAGSVRDERPSEGYGAAKALICNPTIGEEMLEALFERKEPFSKLGEDRWELLVAMSEDNKRLTTRRYTDDIPDIGHYGIQKSIFNLLSIAPVNTHWVRTLYSLLSRLDFQRTANPDRIDDVLSRWAALNDRTESGELIEGYYTELSLRDEFRCLIAAMYGRGFPDHRTVVFGSSSATDVTSRCAYYGKADLTLRDMKRGFKRDDDVYLFAISLNENVYNDAKQTKLLEEQLGVKSGLTERYRQYREQWRDGLRERPSAEQELQERMTGHIDRVERKVDVLGNIAIWAASIGAAAAMGYAIQNSSQRWGWAVTVGASLTFIAVGYLLQSQFFGKST